MESTAADASSTSGGYRTSVLIVDDEPAVRKLCTALIHDAGLRAVAVSNTEDALVALEEDCLDLMVTDLKVPVRGGMALAKEVRTRHPGIGVVLLTQYGDMAVGVEATRLGVIDCIAKPFGATEFQDRLLASAMSAELHKERLKNAIPGRSPVGHSGLVGESLGVSRIRELVRRASQHEYPVLILGETGTGKELVARLIHYSGPRARCPFVAVDCSTLAPTLFESELFGHTKGAFTGALESRTGLIEAARTGTLFLDEIGDLPKELQAKLLRAIQEKEIRPVGATAYRHVDLRIIAATNRDLAADVANGRFREDLYYRLNVVQLQLPTLRERKSDIPLLLASFLEKFGSDSRHIENVSPDVWFALLAYDWPGNVRELENAVERAIVLGSGPVLREEDFGMHTSKPTSNLGSSGEPMQLLKSLERDAILRALREARGDKREAARVLGIGRTTLYRKLNSYHTESRGHL